jgi:diguanylate cyclase (GGDEF)-like protein
LTNKTLAELSEALMIAERRRQEAQRLSGVGFWELDHRGGQLYWSEEIHAIYDLQGQALAPDYTLFLSLIHDADREHVNTTYRDSVKSGTEYDIRYRIKAGNRIKWIEARGVTLYDAEGRAERSIGTAQDVTEVIVAQQRIEHLAYHDPLTDLPNRQRFSDRMDAAVRAAQDTGTQLAILFIDLDNFKLINDRYGHDIGDEVLIGIAQRLRACAGTGDTFARIGGDEFAGILKEVDETNLDDAITEIKQAIDGVYETRVKRFDVTASIGVTLYPHDCAAPDSLLRHADQAMYEAKERGRSRVQYFDTVRSQSNWSRLQLQREIKVAIEQNLFQLYFQPRVGLADGRLAGAEALLRWFKPQGPIAPPTVIEAISGTPLEWQLDSWVIETLLRHREAFLEAGIAGPFCLNINPSTIENGDFPAHLGSLLEHAGGLGEDIEIEILEVSSIHDFDNTHQILRACKSLGISFSLDDFGTGYSSLTHFHFLPIDKLKIDQRFIKHLRADSESLAIVKSILALAHANHRPVIAEGVETDEIARTLTALGCEYGQGFGLARPMPASDYIRWAQTWDPQAFVQRIHSPGKVSL